MTEKRRCQNDTLGDTATKLAEQFGVSRRTVFRCAEFSQAIDTIEANINKEDRSKVLEGKPKLTQKEIIWAANKLTPKAQQTLFEYEKSEIKEIINLF